MTGLSCCLYSGIAREPVGKLIFRDLAGGESLELKDPLFFRRRQLKPIQPQEGYRDREGGSLVSIDKWMIRGESFCVAGSHLCEQRCLLGIREEILRSSKRRLEETHIANTRRTAVKHEKLLVHGKNDILSDQDGLAHSASFRRTSRFSRITSRAASI